MNHNDFNSYIELLWLIHLAKELKLDVKQYLEPLQDYNGSNQYLLDLKNKYGV